MFHTYIDLSCTFKKHVTFFLHSYNIVMVQKIKWWFDCKAGTPGMYLICLFQVCPAMVHTMSIQNKLWNRGISFLYESFILLLFWQVIPIHDIFFDIRMKGIIKALRVYIKYVFVLGSFYLYILHQKKKKRMLHYLLPMLEQKWQSK